MQQLNLDWLLDQMKKIMHMVPFNGVSGDVLQRTVDGAAWMPIGAVSMDIHGLTSTTPDAADELPVYDVDMYGNYKVTVQDLLDMVPAAPVTSVNGQTGAVSLTIPTQTGDLINDAGFVDAAGAAAAAPVQSVDGKTGTVITDQLYFGTTQDTVTVSIDTSVDPSNDGTMDTSNVYLMKSPDKRVLRLCGKFSFTSGDNTGWRTFVTDVQDIADIAADLNCDWTCDMYETPSNKIMIGSVSFCYYKVLTDKTIQFKVYVAAANTSYFVKCNAIPVQIAH